MWAVQANCTGRRNGMRLGTTAIKENARRTIHEKRSHKILTAAVTLVCSACCSRISNNRREAAIVVNFQLMLYTDVKVTNISEGTPC